ncbi:MAG TPA: transporter substrate-binding domain-containing protein [Spirochaetales bacterium]|nr:transporter substrate-binding domain-containing protein [Spirochaetales bacterium]HRY55174.1 transporter substrate-binding domain-containing protein [Spirochaetia bacterium]
MRTRSIGSLLALAASLLLSCSEGRGAAPGEARAPRGEAGPAREAPLAEPSAAARKLAARLAAGGGLRAATTATRSIYEPPDPGEPGKGFGGFHARLAADFASWLGVGFRIEVLPFDRFFSVGGKVYGEGLPPPPAGSRSDVFEGYDLIVHSLAPLPWREPLMRVLPFLPNRILTITRAGEELASLRDLAGKTAVVSARSSYESSLRAIRERLGLGFAIVALPDDRLDAYAEVQEGRADLTLRDADTAAYLAPAYPGLSIGLPVSDLQLTGWAVAPEDGELEAAFREYLAAAKASGSYARLWLECFGMKLEDYYSLLRYREAAALAPTGPQRARLERIRRAGGLRVAIQAELSVYEPPAGDSGGEPRGLHYLLVKRLERDLGIPVILRPVSFEEFLSLGGSVPERAKTDPSYSYAPDLLEEVELYVGSLSPLAWRKKFLRFVGLYPNRLMYVGRGGLGLDSPAALARLRLSLLPDTSYESWLRAREAELGSRLGFLPAGSERAAVEAVAAGKADLTISDATIGLALLREYPGLSMAPASSEVDTISWAVAKGDEDLASLLDSWVEAIKGDGSFEGLWLESFGSSFAEYLGMIAAED